MNSTTSDWPPANTQHGMLVAFGEFLKQHGVIDRLMGVTIQQKTRRFAPQTKLAELLADLPRRSRSLLARSWVVCARESLPLA